MTWRCTWCGKAHAENDPPCDACGHNVFEPAEADPSSRTVDTGPQYVWVCSDCGRQHVKNNPPCSRCGGHDLEKTAFDATAASEDLVAPGWVEVAKPYLPILVAVGLALVLVATGAVSLPGLP
ncbi:hypothetical protein [Salinilacihabitans rarus]|uniref:hypothetical protein n=1 Tax=Salinilacihabitans rarus TaxID=2961596 RepID=UPI003CCDDFC7